MFTFIIKGGPVMFPIILGSILGLAIIIDRMLVLQRVKMDCEGFAQDIFRLIRRSDFNAALNLCYQNSQHPLPRLFKVGIEKRNLTRVAAQAGTLMF